MCAHRVAPEPMMRLSKRPSGISLEKGIFSISSILAEGESTLSLSSYSPRATRPSSSTYCLHKAGQTVNLDMNHLRRNETLPNLESPAIEELESHMMTSNRVSSFLRSRPQRQTPALSEYDAPGLFLKFDC